MSDLQTLADDARAELLSYLMVSQLFARARTVGVWTPARRSSAEFTMYARTAFCNASTENREYR